MALTEINSLGIKDGEVKTADLAADAVTGAKIADDAINSEHYTDASIDHAHLANDAVDGDNIADDSITSEHYVDGSIDTAHIADDQITQAKIANNAVRLDELAGIARGKIIYGDSSGNPAVLTVGSANYVLKSDGTDISWGEVAAGAQGTGSDKIFWENGQTVTGNYTITNNQNAMSAGPITINNSVTVTIGDGETWTIV